MPQINDPVAAAAQVPQATSAGLAYRAKLFSMDSVQNHPITTSAIVASTIPNHHVKTLGPLLDSAWKYVAQKDSAGGIPGAMLGLRLAALNLPAPQQAKAHANIDALQQLNEPSLIVQLASLTPAQVLGLALMVPTQADLVQQQALAESLGTSVRQGTPQETNQTQYVLQQYQQTGNYVPTTIGNAPPADTGGTVFEQGMGQVEKLLTPIGAVLNYGAAKLDSLGVGTPGAFLMQNLARAGRLTEEFVALPFEAASQLTGQTTHWADTIRYWDLTKDDPLATAAFDLAGVDINAPENQRMRQTVNFIAQFGGQVALFQTIGAFGDALKTPGDLISVEKWVNMRPGMKVFRAIDTTLRETNPTERVGALYNSTNGVDPILASRLTDAWVSADGMNVPEAGFQAMKTEFINYVNDPKTPWRLRYIQDQITKLDVKLTSPDTAPEELPGLKSQRTQLEQLKYTIANKDAVPRWPTRAAVQGVLKGGPPTSWFSKIVDTLYSREAAQGFDPLKIVDNLPGRPKVWNWNDPGRPSDWAAQNYEVIGRELRSAGVPFAKVNALLGDMGNGDFFNWIERAGALLADAAKDRIGPELLHRLTHWFETPVEGRMRSPVVKPVTLADGTPDSVVRNVLVDQNNQPLPSQMNHFAGSVFAPNMNDIISATSWTRDLFRANPELASVYNITQQLWRLSTGIGKPIAVMTHALPIFLKIQIDQALTNVAAGYSPIAIIPRVRAAIEAADVTTKIGYARQVLLDHGIDISLGVPIDIRLAREYAQANLAEINASGGGQSLGQVAADFNQADATTWVPITDTAVMANLKFRFMEGSMSPEEATRLLNGMHHQIVDLASVEDMRTLARFGPVETLRRMQEPGTTLNDYYETYLKPQLAKANDVPIEQVTPAMTLDFLSAKDAEINQITLDQPSLRQSVYTGKWSPDPAVKFRKGGTDAYNTAYSELVDVTDRIKVIRETGQDTNLLSDLIQRRAAIIDKLATMEELHNWGDHIPLDVRYQFTSELANRLRTGEYEFPPTTKLESPNSLLTGEPSLIHSSALRRFTTFMYKGMRVMSWGDRLLTRGSMYFQEFARTFARLKEMGWSDEYASASADARARFVVRDWMHDIANKSTIQRQLQNQFWFAPAWQKTLVRWLYKIPERIGGGFGAYSVPIGYAELANLVKSGSGMLKSLGIIRTTTGADGKPQDVLMVPNPTRLFDWIPALQKMPNLVTMDPLQLNYILREPVPGGGLGTSFVLGTAAQYIPILKSLNDAVNKFGFRMPGSDVLTKAYEALTGQVPFWSIGDSHKYQQYVVDRAHDRAIQYAYAELTKEGTVPPNPTGLTSAEYNVARDAYWARLDEVAQQYTNGIGLTYLLSSVVGPTSYKPTTTEEAQWKEFLAASGISGQRTPADYALIDKYLGDHPNSLAFNIGMFNYSGKGITPDSGYQGFLDALTSGDLAPRTPAEFQARVALAQEWQYRDQATVIALNKAGLKNWDKMTPQQQLLNQGAYNAALTPVWKDWQTFLDNNKGAAAIYETYRSPSAIVYDQIHQMEANRQDLIAGFVAKGISTTAASGKVDQKEANLYDKLAKQTGYGMTTAEHIAWYKYHYMNDYYNKTNAIYDKIDAINASGDPNTKELLAAQYDKLRAFNNSLYGGIDIGARTGKGMAAPVLQDHYPSPEEYRYSKLQPADQLAKRQDWSSLPPMWLSSFQYQSTYGKAPDQATMAYFDQEAKIQAQFTDGTKGLSASSNAYVAWKKWQQQTLDYWAKRLGASGAHKLETISPGERLAAAGLVPDSQGMNWIISKTRWVRSTVENAGFTYYGSSASAEYYRGWLEGSIAIMRDPTSKFYDPAVDKFWTDLSVQTQMTNDNALYRLILFGADSGFTISTDYHAEDQMAKSTVKG